MVNWIVKDFKQEHADQIISYGMNSKLMEVDASYKEHRICTADKGNAYTLFVDNKPIVAGGIIILWQGVAEGWVMASQTIYDVKFLACKEIKRRTDILCKKNNLVKMFIVIHFSLCTSFCIDLNISWTVISYFFRSILTCSLKFFKCII